MNAAQVQAHAARLCELTHLTGPAIQWARNPYYEDHLMFTICQRGVIDVEDARRLFSSQPNWARSRMNEGAVLTRVMEATFTSRSIPSYKIVESVKRRLKVIMASYKSRCTMGQIHEPWSRYLSRQRSEHLWFACMYDLLQDHTEFCMSSKIYNYLPHYINTHYGVDPGEGQVEALEEREMIRATMKVEMEDDLRRDQTQARREMAELRRAVEDLERAQGDGRELQHHRARDRQVEQGRAPPPTGAPPPAAAAQAPPPAQVPGTNVAPGNAAVNAAAAPVGNVGAVRNPGRVAADPPVQQDEGWIECGICKAMLPDDGDSMALHISTCLGTTEGATMGSCPICEEAFASSMSTLARERHVQACCDGGLALKRMSREHAIFAATSETIPRDPATKQIGECTICLEDFEIGENLARLSCYCVMHSACIKEYWGRPGTFCPTHRDDQCGQKA